MSNISRKHHYIPQFYLKGFTSADGKFLIYDVEKGRFIRDGKLFSPESYFFEVDGNNLITDDEESDFIESIYSHFDAQASIILSRIKTSDSSVRFRVDDSDIAMLQCFIGLMYYRVPTNFNTLKNDINNKRFVDFGLILKNGDDIVDDVEFENNLKLNPNLAKILRLAYPLLTYIKTIDCKTAMHILPFPAGGPLVCSDNPIICMNPDTFDVYTDDFIFPLDSTRLFVRGEKIRKCSEDELAGILKIEIDMLIFKQATKYVSCTNQQYLEVLDKLYEIQYGNLKDLRRVLMNRFIDYTS